MRNHRVIARKVPLRPILFRRQVVMDPQVPLERLKPFAVLKTNEVIRRHGFLDGDGGFKFYLRFIELGL